MRLRPLTHGDLGTIFAWSQDERFCRACGWTLGLTRAQTDAFWSGLIRQPPADFLRLGIESDGELCGYADLAGINTVAGTAEFGIAVGPSATWGRGLGLAAGTLMLAHGFQTLGLSIIWAEVHAPNARSLALMERLGFRRTGLAPHQDRFDGQLVDLIRFDLSAARFASRTGGSTGAPP